jgi:hypothetical protein
VAEQFVRQATAPATVIAIQYHYGQSLDEVHDVARFDDRTAKLTEIHDWRSLIIQLGRPDDPDYVVVPDGSWLVYNQQTLYLAAWGDESFTAEHRRPQPDLIGEVASVIGQHMVCRESTRQIATAALAAADAYHQMHTIPEPPF